MIKILGIKRIAIFLVLFVLNVAAASAVYIYTTPEIAKKDRELLGLRGQIGTLRSDIDRLQIEFDQLAEQQAEFDQLKKKGFFGAQGRREAELIFEKIQQQAGVISAIANIKPGVLSEDEEAAKAEHLILSSPIEVKIEAIDDIDIFKYIYLVEQGFPGHITIEDIDLERKMDVSGPVLRSMANGENPALAKATIKMMWRTMIPKPDNYNLQGAG